ncbi:hypothetical protein [Dyella amyloliquefaciens]|uniref:hypothetical protein n=1 Tax=Dyella amyloliquefaciens TaxID=1770545 RepID=UPI0013EE9888|nr:hypothetical protein [Dyella amyloliquefaciens]
MTRLFWKGQQAVAFVAAAGGVLFWLGYGLSKGIQFALVAWLILQIPMLFEYWKNRR